MYRHGQGVPQDYAEAVKWYRLAAEQGNASAQSNLGVMYRLGRGVPQDNAEAVKWYRRAAEQGNAKAQSNLGVMYGLGQGVPQDYVQAHLWFNLAASRLRPGETRDKAIKNRDLVAARMTPAQVAEAQKLARQWKPRDDRVD
jgi:TPR repeat protein